MGKTQVAGQDMGKSRVAGLQNAMIDTATKQQGVMGVVGDREKVQACREGQHKHKAINLPKNVIDSDSEDYEEEQSSEDDNDQITDYCKFSDRKEQKMVDHQVTCDFQCLALKDKQKTNEDKVGKLVQKLNALASIYKDSYSSRGNEPKGLKARSPFRNKFNGHNQKPFERHDLSVTTQHGNGGRVFVQSLKPIVPEPVANFIHDNVLLDAIKDKEFIESLISLPDEKLEQVILNFITEQDGGDAEGQVVPQELAVQQAMMSPQMSLTPDNSPNNQDLYDSSYETGSPGSTVVTSPGSPGLPRTSESDQELDPPTETVRPQPLASQTNIVIIPTPVIPKWEPKMLPRGEVVNFNPVSASDRLYELSNSTSFCTRHFTIELVRVVLITNAKTPADGIQGFSKSLMNKMMTKILSKPHEGDIWQLSVYAHIQFLLPRKHEYRSALKACNEQGHPLLYIAAIRRYEKPLIARYIAESMSQVGFDPTEPLDDAGNTILHLVAEQGDSHVHVLSELLMVVGVNNKHLFNVRKSNMVGQTPLHVAARSPRPKRSTLMSLLRMGANPFDLDISQKTPLYYYIQSMSNSAGHHWEEMDVIRKMIQAPMSLDKESLQILEGLKADSSVSADIVHVIEEEIKRNCSKDLRPKKLGRC